MLKTIPIELIEDNPFNSRIQYSPDKIQSLAASMESIGLLCPIDVRQRKDRYELIYGHCRVRAARLLGWKTVHADIKDFKDEQMAVASLVENVARNDLSDYEKAMCFQKLNKDFGMNYEVIGRLVGYSKQHVSHHIQMLRLFDEDVLSKNPDLRTKLTKISEHHARIILQIGDQIERIKVIDLVNRENLTVRDLQRIILKLNGLFPMAEKTSAAPSFSTSRNDMDEIERTLRMEIELNSHGNYGKFSEQHAFDSNFSLFSANPPNHLFEGEDAQKKVKDWFFKVAPLWSGKIRGLKIHFFSNVAVATFYAEYCKKHNKNDRQIHRASVVFVRQDGAWKIVHEHYSPLTTKESLLREISVEAS